MIPLKTVRYYLSDKGIQEKVSPLILTPRELQTALNVHFYETGAWTKRAGYKKRYTNDMTGTPVGTGLYNLIKRDGTSYFISSADKLYNGAQDDASPTLITGGLTFTTGTNGENLMSFVTFNNKALGTDGVAAVWQYDGTTASALAGSPPVAPIIAVYNNFVFLAGNSTYPYRLYFCNDGNETTWTGTDYIDIGDLTAPITGLAVLFGKLYIFTRRGFYELRGYDRDTFSVDEVNLSVGCVARKSIVKVDNNLVFLSDRGIYSFDGINVHYLSEPIQITIEGLNYLRTPYVVAELYKAKNQVWFAVSTGSNSQNNEVICMTYNPTASESAGITKEDVAFSVYTGMAFNALGLEKSSTELDRLYAVGYAGRIWLQDTGNNDDGAGINFQVKTPPIDMGSPENFKRFRYLVIYNKQEGSYSLNIGYISDFGLGGSTTTVTLSVSGASSLWGTMIWGTDDWGGSTTVRSRVGLKSNGHYLEFTFSNANPDQPIVIRGFSLLAQDKGIAR